MRITKQWLEKRNACQEGVEWFLNQKERDAVKVTKALVKDKHLDWAIWLLPRTMKYKQYVRFAIYSAEQCLPMWNKHNKQDTKVKEAIEAAKRCVKNPSKKNKEAAWSAARSAWSAWSAARSAARSAAWSAARSAWSAAESAELKKIIKFGIKILTENTGSKKEVNK